MLEPERAKCSRSTRIPALGWSAAAQHPDRLAEVRGLRPRRELEVDGEAERPGQLTQPREPVDLAGPVGVGQLRDDVTGAEFGAGLEEALEVTRVLVRADPGQLDVEDLDAGRGQPHLGGAHQRRVGGQRIVRLLRGDPGQPQAHVAVAGVGGRVDQLRRGEAQRGQVGQRVVVPLIVAGPSGRPAARAAGARGGRPCGPGHCRGRRSRGSRRRAARPRRRPASRASRCRSAGTRRSRRGRRGSSAPAGRRGAPAAGRAGRRGRRSSCRGSSAPARRARASPGRWRSRRRCGTRRAAGSGWRAPSRRAAAARC